LRIVILPFSGHYFTCETSDRNEVNLLLSGICGISNNQMVFFFHVAVKPEYVKVFKEDGSTEISSSALIGPFQEGQELKLSCQSGGGKPIPDITWWNGTHKLPGKYY